MEEPSFKLEKFEGPLDLLLKLIQKNKVEITDIPISLILDQYMEYLGEMQRMDMEIAGEFIDTAAELMLIKSRMLLPKPAKEEQEDPRKRLADALLEYQRAKLTAEKLAQRYKLYGGRIAKEPETIETEVELGAHDMNMLRAAFKRIMARHRELSALPERAEPKKTLGDLLSYRAVSLPGRIFGVMRMLYEEGDCLFEDMLMASRTRGELIATFVAALELLRSQRVKIVADDGGTEITLSLDRVSHNRFKKAVTEESM